MSKRNWSRLLYDKADFSCWSSLFLCFPPIRPSCRANLPWSFPQSPWCEKPALTAILWRECVPLTEDARVHGLSVSKISNSCATQNTSLLNILCSASPLEVWYSWAYASMVWISWPSQQTWVARDRPWRSYLLLSLVGYNVNKLQVPTTPEKSHHYMLISSEPWPTINPPSLQLFLPGFWMYLQENEKTVTF